MRATIPMSNIVALTDVVEVVQLVPKFGAAINREWDCDNLKFLYHCIHEQFCLIIDSLPESSSSR